jgi:phospholipid-binding lipoprotein MlaA
MRFRILNYQGRKGILCLILVIFLFGTGLGCTTNHRSVYNIDPLESMNRTFHAFNNTLDRFILKPVVDVYTASVNENLRGSVSNFFDNLTYPNVILNSFLQGKGKQGFSDASRFLLNTTFGVGGLFDAATVFGFEKHDEDFGQTLAVWGVKQGPYLEIPFVGPTTTREIPNFGGSGLTNVFTWIKLPLLVAGFTYAAPLVVLGIIDKRARVESELDARDALALDPYVFTREAYIQRRNFLIHDGDPPVEEMYSSLDDFENELLEFEEDIGPSGLEPSYD